MEMECGGNFTVNSIFEAKLNQPNRRPEPNAAPETRKNFAKEKYIEQRYLDISKACDVMNKIVLHRSSDVITQQQQYGDTTSNTAAADDSWFSFEATFSSSRKSDKKTFSKPKIIMALGKPLHDTPTRLQPYSSTTMTTREEEFAPSKEEQYTKRPSSSRLRRRRSLDYEIPERPLSSRRSLDNDSMMQDENNEKTEDFTSCSDESFTHVTDELAAKSRLRQISRTKSCREHTSTSIEKRRQETNRIRGVERAKSLPVSNTTESRSKIESARRRVRESEEKVTSLICKTERRRSMPISNNYLGRLLEDDVAAIDRNTFMNSKRSAVSAEDNTIIKCHSNREQRRASLSNSVHSISTDRRRVPLHRESSFRRRQKQTFLTEKEQSSTIKDDQRGRSSLYRESSFRRKQARKDMLNSMSTLFTNKDESIITPVAAETDED